MSKEKERVEQPTHVADIVQSFLEEAYGITDLRLKKASNFLRPKNREDSPAYSDNRGRFRFSHLKDRGVTEFMNDVDMRILFKLKRLPFEALDPTIYIPPITTRRLQEVPLPDMVVPERLRDLEAVTEGVGRFVYVQSQWKLHNQLPGEIMPEAIALLDWYIVLQRLVKEKERVALFDPDNQTARLALREIGKKFDQRKSFLWGRDLDQRAL